MIVADTNLIAYLLVPGDRTEIARRAWEAAPDWRAPVLWRSEFRSVLVQNIRAGRLETDWLPRIWAEAVDRVREEPVDDLQALRIALDRDISAYDAEFAALADTLGARLVTEDRRLLRACPDLAVTPEAFVA